MGSVLAPLPGDNPAGEDLRYIVYDEIKEARREDDPFERREWQRTLKNADWDEVITLSEDALTKKTKDLQIAAWLTEALTVTEGFEGFATGLKVMNSFLTDFWEQVHPRIEDADLEIRIGRLEFLNDNLWVKIKQVAITDKSKSQGYSWFKWQESRRVGYEKDTKDKKLRAELIAEGKLPAEDFDTAKAASSKDFYIAEGKKMAMCRKEFDALEKTVDEKFGQDAPRLGDLKTAIDDCEQLLERILKEKREKEPDPVPEPEPNPKPAPQPGSETKIGSKPNGAPPDEVNLPEQKPVQPPGRVPNKMNTSIQSAVSESGVREQALWQEALATLKTSGVNTALGKLLDASSAAPSVREKNRYRLLMAKLCLQANRPDLARPIVEDLNSLVEELKLERWESPHWIADILDSLYQCLTIGDQSSEDAARAKVLFQKLCTLDVTKAMLYNQ